MVQTIRHAMNSSALRSTMRLSLNLIKPRRQSSRALMSRMIRARSSLLMNSLAGVAISKTPGRICASSTLTQACRRKQNEISVIPGERCFSIAREGDPSAACPRRKKNLLRTADTAVPITAACCRRNTIECHSARLSWLVANTQPSAEPEFECGNNDAAPHASQHADCNGGDCQEGQHLTDTVHAQNNSTAVENRGTPEMLPASPKIPSLKFSESFFRFA